MNLNLYKKSLISRKAYTVFVTSFLSMFGFLALIVNVVTNFSAETTANIGLGGITPMFFIALIWGFYKSWPRYKISRKFSTPGIEIKIEEGDVIAANGNIVIGMSDTFDTEKGQIIKPETVQGQFLTTIYHDDRAQLDLELENELKHSPFETDSGKSKGKNSRFPIGTVVCLVVGQSRYFCVAYSRMENSLKAQSTLSMLNISLESLWESLSEKGQNNNVSMAIIGSDTARLGNITSHEDLIKLIVTSFVLNSRKKVIAPVLTILIHPKDREKINILAINDFLQSF